DRVRQPAKRPPMRMIAVPAKTGSQYEKSILTCSDDTVFSQIMPVTVRTHERAMATPPMRGICDSMSPFEEKPQRSRKARARTGGVSARDNPHARPTRSANSRRLREPRTVMRPPLAALARTVWWPETDGHTDAHSCWRLAPSAHSGLDRHGRPESPRRPVANRPAGPQIRSGSPESPRPLRSLLARCRGSVDRLP